MQAVSCTTANVLADCSSPGAIAAAKPCWVDGRAGSSVWHHEGPGYLSVPGLLLLLVAEHSHRHSELQHHAVSIEAGGSSQGI